MKVAFRVDASLAIGSGHVMRCLTVADALAARGHSSVFLSREAKGDRLDAVRTRGHGQVGLAHRDTGVSYAPGEVQPAHSAWLAVPWEEDASETREVVELAGVDLLVLDHYALDARWERAACPPGVRRMAIDDLADRPHEVELLLDQNLGRRAVDYEGLVPSACRLCLGPGFAMVASRFGELRESALERRVADPLVRRVLISMGGVDADDATGACLEALADSSLPDAVQVTVVMGGRAPNLERVRVLAAGLRLHTEVVVDVRDMAERMAEADLALGGAGGTAWERCAVGLPTIAVVLAENQRAGAAALADAGAALVLDAVERVPAGLPGLVDRLLQPDRLVRMARASAAAVDGAGLPRLVAAMEELR